MLYRDIHITHPQETNPFLILNQPKFENEETRRGEHFYQELAQKPNERFAVP